MPQTIQQPNTPTAAASLAVICGGINKSFGEACVLENVSFSVPEGHSVALMGENGAGKSTLLNVFAGLLAPTAGALTLFGQRVERFTPVHAHALGVQIVTQELSLIPDLSVWENIFLGREETFGPGLAAGIDTKSMIRKAQDEINAFGVTISVHEKIRNLSLPYAQIVEIIKSISRRPKLLLLDEPTSSLGDTETEHLFAIVTKLRSAGVTIIFTTHKMNEIERMADDVIVLRDGKITLESIFSEVTPDEVISAMVGRDLLHQHLDLPTIARAARPTLNVHGYSARTAEAPERNGIDLELRPGEIIGLAGIAGAGRTSFLESLFGIHPAKAGQLFFKGQPYAERTPQRSVKKGIGYVPEDRKIGGLVLSMNVCNNSTLPKIDHFLSRLGLIDAARESHSSRTALEQLKTKYHSPNAEVAQLSGGNQQKVLVARWLIANEPELILLDEPTRGIDVGAKADIYELIVSLASRGAALLISSSELPELMLLCHRIAVFRDGRIIQMYERSDFSEEKIVKAAIGA